MRELVDSFGRRFHYLRLSVTDVCNFRCVYCLPKGYQKTSSSEEPPLSVGEIRNLVGAFSELGFSKVRLTGGEPTVRQDIVEIAREVAGISGIRKVGLSTNGYRLARMARPLAEAGVTALNVSVDSLDPVRFRQITGQDKLREVLDGVDAAFDAGIAQIKINAVLMRGLNDGDLELFMDWARRAPVSIRFIELMRTGQNAELFEFHHVSAGELRFWLLRQGWRMKPREADDGPAVEFERAGSRGRIGIIAPYGEDFCRSCNRLRVSSRGALRLCLFGEGDTSLRSLLQSPSQRDELVARIEEVILRKPVSHSLREGRYGDTWNLSAIGG